MLVILTDNNGLFKKTEQSKAIDTFRGIYAFLSTNPREIVTLILEDYVHSPNGLSIVFNDSGVSKYWFPIKNMPLDGNDWPLVSDMVTNDHRLVVFTSNKSKQQSEGIAYQWNYMVENQCELSSHLVYFWSLYLNSNDNFIILFIDLFKFS